MPKDCKLKYFRVRVPTHWTDYCLTNEVMPHETAAAEHESSVRRAMEQFHRKRKPLTDVQTCPCRLARNQSSHIDLTMRTYSLLCEVVLVKRTVSSLNFNIGLINGESVILLHGIYATRLRPVWQ